MALDFLKSDEQEEDAPDTSEFVELDAEPSDAEDRDVTIRAETLTELDDVDMAQKHLRNGDIVWVNIKQLRGRDMSNLKRAVKRLRKTVQSVDGDMAGVDEDWIIASPSYANIARSDDGEKAS
ncbi:DUF552 domain-containing protein [Nanohaloarchaea archaeon]|jgi:SepF-like predicted cell division protein (DUF552 family)|nr:DUF552 domain-containing protein [Candidatus Nanohaloarchaea archaeon]